MRRAAAVMVVRERWRAAVMTEFSWVFRVCDELRFFLGDFRVSDLELGRQMKAGIGHGFILGFRF